MSGNHGAIERLDQTAFRIHEAGFTDANFGKFDGDGEHKSAFDVLAFHETAFPFSASAAMASAAGKLSL